MAGKEVRLKRIEQNLCPDCGGVRDTDKSVSCSRCAEIKRASYYRRKALGLCVTCGKPVEEKGTRCNACKEKGRKREKENYEYFKGMGICITCGSRKAAPGAMRCEICLANQAESAIRWREKYPEKYAEYVKKTIKSAKQKRDEAKAKGICTHCLKREAAQGHTLCMVCLAKSRESSERQRRKRGQISYSEAIGNGVCTHCRREKATNGKLCKSCYDIMSQRINDAKNTDAYKAALEERRRENRIYFVSRKKNTT